MSSTPSENLAVPGIHIHQGRDVTLRAGGDIVAGDKTTIHNYYGPKPHDITKAPYKFLSYYDIGDRDIFFGRDAVIEELSGEIPRHRVLIINGQSGSGKTSLLSAGLIPRLAENGYLYVYFRDYTNPLEQLREYFRHHPDFALPDADNLSLLQMLRTIRSQQESPVVVIFDQFERFLINVAAEPRREFLQQLRECLESDLTADELNLVISLRDDFYGKLLLEAEAIIPTFDTDSHHHNLRKLNRDEARLAIIQPLKRIPNIGFDSKFVDEVLLPHLMGASGTESQAVLPDTKIEPPHLQIVCNQLYEAARDRYRQQLEDGEPVRIGFDIYHDLGETDGILRSYLDGVVNRVSIGDSEQIAVVRSIMKMMIETVGTRRFVSVDSLSDSLPDLANANLDGVLKRLREARVLEARRKEQETEYSLSHEYMVAEVQSWFDQRELDRRQAHEIVERGLVRWSGTNALLDKEEVAIVRRSRPENATSSEAAELLRLSENRLRGERRRKLALVISLTVAALLMLVSVILGLRASAEREAKNAARLRESMAIAAKEAAIENSAHTRSTANVFGASLVVTATPSEALGLLEAVSPLRMRGFAWRHVWGKVFGRPTLLDTYDAGKLTAMAHSADRKLIAAASDDGMLRLFSMENNDFLEPINCPERLTAMALSDNGQMLAYATNGTITLWRLEPREMLPTPKLDGGEVSALAFAPHEDLLAIGGHSGVQFCSIDSQEVAPATTGTVGHLDFSSDGDFLAIGAYNSVRIVRTSDPNSTLWTFTGRDGEHPHPVSDLEFSPDNKTIAIAFKDVLSSGFVRTWRLSSEEPMQEYYSNSDKAIVLSYSPSGKYLAIAGTQHTDLSPFKGYLDIWNVKTRKVVQGLINSSYTPFVGFIDERYVYTGSSGIDMKSTEIKLHQLETDEPVYVSDDPIDNIVFSQDGTLLALAVRRNFHKSEYEVEIWDANAEKRLRSFSAAGTGLTFLPGTSRIVTSDENGLKIWDSQAENLLDEIPIDLKGHAVTEIHVSPTSDHIVALTQGKETNEERQVFLVNVHDKTARRIDSRRVEWKAFYYSYYRVAFSPDGSVLAIGNDSGTIDTWDVRDSTAKLKRLATCEDPIYSLAFGMSGERVYFTTKGRIVALDARTGQSLAIAKASNTSETRMIISHQAKLVVCWSNALCEIRNLDSLEFVASVPSTEFEHVAITPDGRTMAVREGFALVLRDLQTGQQLATLQDFSGDISAMAFSADGQKLAVVQEHDELRLWKAEVGNATVVLRHHLPILAAAFSGDAIAFASPEAPSKCIHVVSMLESQKRSIPSSFESSLTFEIWSVALSADGDSVFVPPAWDTGIEQRDVETGDLIKKFEGGPVECVAVDAKGKQLAGGTRDGSVFLYAVDGDEQNNFLAHEGAVLSIAYSPDCEWVASSGEDGRVKVWSASTQVLSKSFQKHSDKVYSVAFSPDGKKLASASADKSVRIWDLKTEQSIELAGHEDRVYAVAYSPDGDRLASAGRDKVIRIWDTTTNQSLAKLNGHTDVIYSLAFSKDGVSLMSASHDGTIRSWDVARLTAESK